jgi:glycosyltransferase involved in cell wall biosynthesis
MTTGHPPTVTVVMIFLNAQAYITEAIESVLAQTYRDFELVLVDDGSTDDSTEIAKGYAARFPNLVRYTEHAGHRNLGMSASRNHGVATGSGRLVSFLDADDIWLPERLHRFVNELRLFPRAGMLYGPTLYWHSWSTPRPPGKSDEELDASEDYEGELRLPTHTVLEPPQVLRAWLASGGACLPGICSLLIRREAYEAIGGFEPSFRGLYEDQVFLSKIALSQPIVVIPEVLDYYRQHAGSCCHQGVASGDYHPDGLHPARRRYLFWLEDYCRQQGVTDRELLRALDREAWPYRSRMNEILHTAPRAALFRAKRTLRQYVPPWLQPPLRGIFGFLW